MICLLFLSTNPSNSFSLTVDCTLKTIQRHRIDLWKKLLSCPQVDDKHHSGQGHYQHNYLSQDVARSQFDKLVHDYFLFAIVMTCAISGDASRLCKAAAQQRVVIVLIPSHSRAIPASVYAVTQIRQLLCKPGARLGFLPHPSFSQVASITKYA